MNPKKYIHDRVVLLLLSINAFLAVMNAATLLFRLNSVHSQGYIAEYRSNLGLSSFKPGNKATFVSFIIFVLAVAVFHGVLSRRIYYSRRQVALAILGLGTLLIILAAIVSNALLGL